MYLYFDQLNFLLIALTTSVWNRVARMLGKREIVPPKPLVTSVGSVRRLTLRSLLDAKHFTWRSLLEKVTLQEPTFREIVLLYRPKELPAEVRKQAIFIKTFRDIPMADLEVVFPERRIGLEPVDLLKFTATGCIGIVTAIINLRTGAGEAVGMAFIGTFLALASKVGRSHAY